MASFLCGFVLPLLLIAASLLNWSLISLVDLIIFLVIQSNVPRRDFRLRRWFLILWGISIFSLLVAVVQAVFLTIWGIKEGQWSFADSPWVKLVGFMGLQSWRYPTVIYFLILQLLLAFICLAVIYQQKLGMVLWRGTYWGHFSSISEQLGSYCKVASCFLLPAIQLVVGISHPSWVSLPFFVCSCVGLVDWSLTSNFSGLFRWWRSLRLYAGFNIVLLYIYQLPVLFPAMLRQIANFVGLYKISAESGWMEICSGLSLICFYAMVCI